MNNWSLKMKEYAPVVVRIALSLVMLWFGTQQLIQTSMWEGLIPSWATSLSGLSAPILVTLNGAFEVIFGTALLLGIFTRITALLLALHLIGITFTMGYTSIGVRDFGLTFALLSVALYGPDVFTLENYTAQRRGSNIS